MKAACSALVCFLLVSCTLAAKDARAAASAELRSLRSAKGDRADEVTAAMSSWQSTEDIENTMLGVALDKIEVIEQAKLDNSILVREDSYFRMLSDRTSNDVEKCRNEFANISSVELWCGPELLKNQASHKQQIIRMFNATFSQEREQLAIKKRSRRSEEVQFLQFLQRQRRQVQAAPEIADDAKASEEQRFSTLIYEGLTNITKSIKLLSSSHNVFMNPASLEPTVQLAAGPPPKPSETSAPADGGAAVETNLQPLTTAENTVSEPPANADAAPAEAEMAELLEKAAVLRRRARKHH